MLKKITSALLAVFLTLSVMSAMSVSVNAGVYNGTFYNKAEKIGEGVRKKYIRVDDYGYKYDQQTINYNKYGEEVDNTYYSYTVNNSGKKTLNSKTSTKFIYNSNGSLKKISNSYGNTTLSYDSKDNLIKSVYGTDTSTYKYNSKGYLTELINYYGKTNYSYDSKGNLIKKVRTYENSSGLKSTEVTSYAYNNQNLLIKKVYDDQTTMYAYNTNGKLTKITSKSYYSSGKTSINTRTNTYDNKGKLIKEVYSGDSYSNVITYTYNSKGNLTKKKSGDWVETYYHNSKGALTKIIDQDGTTAFKYNSKGDLTKKTVTYKNGNKDITTFWYNSSRDLIKEVRSYGETRTDTITYTGFDKNVYEYVYSNIIPAIKFQIVIDKKVPLTNKKAQPDIFIGFDYDESHSTLSKGADYTISYANNTKCGTGKALIKLLDYDSCTIEVPFTIVPAQVKSVKATKTNKTSIALSWAKVDCAKYYKVEKSLDGKTWSTVKTVTANSMTVSSLKAGTKYQFRVKALDSTKKYVGKASAVLKVTTRS